MAFSEYLNFKRSNKTSSKNYAGSQSFCTNLKIETNLIFYFENPIEKHLFAVSLFSYKDPGYIYGMLNVSKSRKQILKFSFEPKTNENIFVFLP